MSSSIATQTCEEGGQGAAFVVYETFENSLYISGAPRDIGCLLTYKLQ